MILVVIVLSFLLESALSNIININSLFIPLFVITALSLLYPYFKNKKRNFVIVCIICGLIYDIIFTSSLFINTLSFGLLSGLIILGYNYINYNIISSNLLNILIIMFYRIISYSLLCVIGYITINMNNLIKSIYSSIIINIIYGFIIYMLLLLINKIFNIKN